MGVPTPADAVAAFAVFVRERLADVGGTLAPLWSRHSDGDIVPAGARHDTAAAARQLAMVIIGAAAPFAPTSHARARLLRQAHASGLLSDRDAEDFRRAEVLALPAAGLPALESDGRFGASG